MPETHLKPFGTLTQAGQTRRLRYLTLVALQQYDLEVASVRLLANRFNTIFRVDVVGGERFVLRINRPGNRTLTDIRSELIWLEALRRETDLLVAEPVPTRDGQLVTTVATPGVPEPRHVALFRWIGGRSLHRSSSPAIVYSLGETMANLHNHADLFAPPDGFTTRRLDWVWPNGEPALIASDEPDDLFTPERREILRAAAERTAVALDRLKANPSGWRFLHADLHLGNVKATKDGLAVLDFDDSLWCHPVQDLGISLCYLQYQPPAIYPDLRSALLAGYTSVRPLPGSAPNEFEIFAMARHLQLVDFFIGADDLSLVSYLPRVVEATTNRLAAWLANES